MRSVPAGSEGAVPTAVIFPRSKRTVPPGMTAPLTVWTVPPTSAIGCSWRAAGVGTAAWRGTADATSSAQAHASRLTLTSSPARPADSLRDPQGFLDENGAHLLLPLARGVILPPIEVLPAVDPRLLATAERGERGSAPEREVAVLSDFDRPDPALHSQLPRGVQGHELQGVRLGHAPVLARLAGFRVQPPRQLAGIGVERDDHARV